MNLPGMILLHRLHMVGGPCRDIQILLAIHPQEATIKVPGRLPGRIDLRIGTATGMDFLVKEFLMLMLKLILYLMTMRTGSIYWNIILLRMPMILREVDLECRSEQEDFSGHR